MSAGSFNFEFEKKVSQEETLNWEKDKKGFRGTPGHLMPSGA